MTGLVNSALAAITAALTAAQESEVRALTLREEKAKLQAQIEELENDFEDLKARHRELSEAINEPKKKPRSAIVLAFDSQRREKAG